MEWLTSGETSAAITSYAIRATTGHGRRPGPRPGRHPGRPRPSLQRRLAEAGSGVRAVAAHPGIATTNLTSHIGSIRGKLGRGFKHLFNDEERGALPTLYAATQDVPGACYAGPDGPTHLRGYPEIGTPSKRAGDADLARRLWELSARLAQAVHQDNR